MQLQLDNTKTYAIALEGGGAKGAYQIGVWKALKEAGIKFNAVSGASVGALNATLMCMGDLDKAEKLWADIRLSQVIDVEPDEEKGFTKLMKGKAELEDIHQLIPQAVEIIKNRGLDVAPLRSWVREVVDAEKIRSSGVELFISAVSLTDKKGLEVRLNDLPEDEISDMLLASSYHPSFKLEKLGGKLYADGGLVDNLPLHVLVENGYKDIIAVRLPGLGWEKRFKMPADVNITTIGTHYDLGFVLNFDAELSRRNMLIGYYDAMRVLYGLYGRFYCVERSMTDREALDLLLDFCWDEDERLRTLTEKIFPKMAKEREVPEGDYYELFVSVLEEMADAQKIEKMNIYKDRELLGLVL